jgi:hypothetical protein
LHKYSTGGAVLGLSAKTTDVSTAAGLKNPTSLRELLDLSSEQLERCDIGLMNLLCAEGLRGAEALNLTECREMIASMARRVEYETRRHLYKFRESPKDYNHSEAYFRSLTLISVLQQDFGVCYNPERIQPGGVLEPSHLFFANSRDVLIHGLLTGKRGGTCSSLPVLYVAVGRRLGYSLFLVSTKGHLFARWDDGGERLNIEGSGIGLNCYSDDHYRRWPFPVSAEEEQTERYFKALKPAEELAIFLSIRASCLSAAGAFVEAVRARAQALRLVPGSIAYQRLLAHAQSEAETIYRPSPIFVPSDPFLQTRLLLGEMSEMELAAERAIWMSRRRNEFRPVPEPVPGIPYGALQNKPFP